MKSFTERSYKAQVNPEQLGSTTLVSALLWLCTPCHALQSNPRYRHLVEKELSQDVHAGLHFQFKTRIFSENKSWFPDPDFNVHTKFLKIL